MKYNINDEVRIIDPKAYLFNAIGVVTELDDTAYQVSFFAVNDYTKEVFIYDCFYYDEDQLQLYKGAY